jgi:hypothetical protein
MPDMQKVLATKERIMDVVRRNGPELPIKIAQQLNISHLFIAAFMSELVGEQRLKLSNLKVGSSPLYYIEGQEVQLEKFIEHVNHKEKEAFRILKSNNILLDEEQEPAIRVALRHLKDFAVPLQVRIGAEAKTVWKLHSIGNDIVKSLIEERLAKIEPPKKEEIVPTLQKNLEEKPKASEETKEKITSSEDLKEKAQVPQVLQAQNTIPQETTTSVAFPEFVRKNLEEKIGEILEEVLVKKKEFTAVIKTTTPLGKQEFFVVAKDKKKITADDLAIALEKAKERKMPALIAATSELDKKAIEYLKVWRNLIKIYKLK